MRPTRPFTLTHSRCMTLIIPPVDSKAADWCALACSIQKDGQIRRTALKKKKKKTEPGKDQKNCSSFIIHVGFGGGILPPRREAQREGTTKNEWRVRQRRGKKGRREKHYLLMYAGETAHYKPRRREKVGKISPDSHTHAPTDTGKRRQTTEIGEYKTIYRGRVDILKTYRGRQRLRQV